MTYRARIEEQIDERLDRIAAELGVSENTPPEQLTRDLGFRFGAKLREVLPVSQELYDYLAESALENFAEVFPLDPDEDTRAFQAILLAPMVSVALTGRGLSVPELAALAGLNAPQLYRVMRKGLSLLFKPADPKPRTGVHREQSGVDHRKARLTVDYDNLLTREWPDPIGDFQPFLLGIIDGARSCLEDPWVRAQVEAGFKSAVARTLRHPTLGDVLDGSVQGAQRVIQGLSDNGLLLTQAERDRALAAGLATRRAAGPQRGAVGHAESSCGENRSQLWRREPSRTCGRERRPVNIRKSSWARGARGSDGEGWQERREQAGSKQPIELDEP